MLYPINEVGKFGVNAEVEPHLLPNNVWTNAKNIRFQGNSAEKIDGYMTASVDSPLLPSFIFNIVTPLSSFTLVASKEKIYAWDGSVFGNVTRQDTGVDVDYTTLNHGDWTGFSNGTIAIVNNKADVPQVWAADSLSTKCVNLANWDADWRCASMRMFKQFFIAMNITKGVDSFPSLLKWSEPAEAGAVPASWDIADPTLLAGESIRLSETQGALVDGLALRDSFILYKEDSVWGMQYVNTSEVFRIFPIFKSGGMISQNCAVEYFNGRHVVFGVNDIYTHDGQQMTSIVNLRVREKIFNAINQSASNVCFVTLMQDRREVLFAYPTGDSELCNEGMLWNYENDTISFCELPNVTTLIRSLIATTSVSDTWATAAGSWNSDTMRWNERLYSPSNAAFLMCTPESFDLLRWDFSQSFGSTPMEVILERVGIALPARSSQLPDTTQKKYITAIWPRITGTVGGIVYISLGYMEDNFSSIDWDSYQEFEIGKDRRVDVRMAGRLFGIRFKTDTAITWKLHGYEIEYTPVGRY